MTDVHGTYPGDDEQNQPPFFPDGLEDAWFEEAEFPEKVWTDEELTEIGQNLYRNLSYWILPPRMRLALQHTEVAVVSGDYEDKSYGKPPVVVSPQPSRIKVEFDEPTYQDLADRFAGMQDVSEQDIAELYIGAGLTLHLLARRIKTMKPEPVERLLNVLGPSGGSQISPVDELAEAIRRADTDFSREEIIDLVHSTVFLNEEHRTYTNTLRFAAGLLFGKQKELAAQVPNDLLRPESNLTLSYRDELKHRLEEQRKHMTFYVKALGMTAMQAKRQAAENLSELQIAVAFPMNSTELRTVLRICRS